MEMDPSASMNLYGLWQSKSFKVNIWEVCRCSIWLSWSQSKVKSPNQYAINTREIHDNDIEEEIREAFRVFDREGHGFITVPDLTHVLQTLGEKLSSEETQVFVRNHWHLWYVSSGVNQWGRSWWWWKHQLWGVCDNAF